MPSFEVMSPNSWTWKPCRPGVRPVISPVTSTSPPTCSKRTTPLTFGSANGVKTQIAFIGACTLSLPSLPVAPGREVNSHAPAARANARVANFFIVVSPSKDCMFPWVKDTRLWPLVHCLMTKLRKLGMLTLRGPSAP